MATMDEIARIAKEFADARQVLRERSQALKDDLETIRRRRLLGIRNAVATSKECRARLIAAIEESKPLFKRPKTQIFHGIKCGVPTSRGTLEWDNSETVIKRLEKLFPDEAEMAIKIEKSLLKKPLGQLAADTLKRIGVRIIPAKEYICAQPTDDQVDKLVDALLKDSPEEEGIDD